MDKKMKKIGFRKKGIVIMMLCTLLVLPMQAASGHEMKEVQKVNMGIYYNGIRKDLSVAPLLIDNITYLPVREVCEAADVTVKWTKSNLYLSGSPYNSEYSLQAQLQAKDYEIASLKRELQALRKTLGIVTDTTSDVMPFEQTFGTDILGTELTATAKELKRLYGNYFAGVTLDFSVTLSNKQVSIHISYDTREEDKVFDGFTDSRVRNFIEAVCETVRERHDDVILTGNIKYNTSSQYSFTYSRQDHLIYSKGSSSYGLTDYLEADILAILKDARSIEIDDYRASIRIEKMEAAISNKREEVTFYLYLDLTNSSDVKAAWKANEGTNNDIVLRSELRALARQISRETDYDVYGEIYDEETDKKAATYDYQEDSLKTYSLS